MPSIPLTVLQEYRSRTFRSKPGMQLKSAPQAIDFVNERGFIFFWPVKNITMPSLWTAVAGDRPVPDNHDDPGHITWDWKDSLLDKHVWYYGRVLKHKNAFISHTFLPYFYALSPNYGSPEDDFADEYQRGLLPLEAKLVFEALVENGPLDTIALRKIAHLSSKNSEGPFNHALDLLQMSFRIQPVGIADAGTWHYAFRYDLTHRVYPDLVDQSRSISEAQARGYLVQKFLQAVGVAHEKEIGRLFGWDAALTHRVSLTLSRDEKLIAGVVLENSYGDFVCTPEILHKISISEVN